MATIGAGGAAGALPGGASGRSGKRPNIVVVMADDMGYSDVGCMGSEIETPNVDRLAGGGIKFNNFYNAARCCPTRASLLTGLYPHQAGVGHMSTDHGTPPYQGFLNRQCVTIAEALKPAGYHTFMSGKWHLGGAKNVDGTWPVDRGFDEHFGFMAGSTSYHRPGKASVPVHNHEPFEPGDDFYTTDDFTDHAIGCIEDSHKKDGAPYFLYLAYNAPHWPLHAKPDDIEKYEDRYLSGWDVLRRERYERMIEMGLVDPDWPLTRRDRGTPPWKAISPWKKKRLARKMAVYAAMVDSMDQNVGRLLRAIEATGESDNTLVMFLADNGACSEYMYTGISYNPKYAKLGDTIGSEVGTEESFATYGRGWSNACNTPFKLHKHWTNEGGISTPLIARWPSVIRRPGETSQEVGHVIDLMATCLDAAGADYPESYDGEDITPLEGKSLVPVFETGRRESHDAIYWEHEGNRAIRVGNHKLVSDYPGSWKLYDMEADRVETNNLARANKGKAQELSATWKDWADRVGVRPWHPLKALKF